MRNKPVRIFIFILILTIIAAIISLPKNYHLQLKIGQLVIDRIISSPSLDFKIGPIVVKNDLETKLGLDLRGGSHFVFEADMSQIEVSDRDVSLEGVKNVIERRVNLFGVSEPVVQSAKVGGSYRVIVELPGIEDLNKALERIGKTAQLDFREETATAAAQAQATSSALINPLLLFGTETGLSGKFLKRSNVVFNQNTGQPQVGLTFNEEGAKLFEEITKRNVGKRVAIFLDNYLVSAPVVNETISGGNAVISGSFTVDEAKDLSKQLNAGALPAPIHVVEQNTIGPTLGEESVNKSMIAGFIGLGLVIFFMIGNYGRLGILATFALIVYSLVSLMLFKLIPVTLTLPGIAGFILSIGMAVDANILIFERIKEEKRLGKPIKLAMELGFGRAWDSIRDANITTLITSFILFNPFDWGFLITSGSVRGFATTLALGIGMSLFTGIIVTRTLVRVFYK